jgi:hypothetical protein
VVGAGVPSLPCRDGGDEEPGAEVGAEPVADGPGAEGSGTGLVVAGPVRVVGPGGPVGPVLEADGDVVGDVVVGDGSCVGLGVAGACERVGAGRTCWFWSAGTVPAGTGRTRT